MAKGRKHRQSVYEQRMAQCIVQCRDDTLCLMKCLCQCSMGDRIPITGDDPDIRVDTGKHTEETPIAPNKVEPQP